MRLKGEPNDRRDWLVGNAASSAVLWLKPFDKIFGAPAYITSDTVSGDVFLCDDACVIVYGKSTEQSYTYPSNRLVSLTGWTTNSTACPAISQQCALFRFTPHERHFTCFTQL